MKSVVLNVLCEILENLSAIRDPLSPMRHLVPKKYVVATKTGGLTMGERDRENFRELVQLLRTLPRIIIEPGDVSEH